jgi:acyl-CoA thioesterase II
MSGINELLSALRLDQIEVNIFRGVTPEQEQGWNRIFGGQVVAQALMAAYRTVDKQVCHSLQAYFIRPGDPKAPVLFEVERSRDGKSFTTRRVAAIQHGAQILNLAASFQIPEAGFEHAFGMPDVPPPETLPDERERLLAQPDVPSLMKEMLGRDFAIEVRIVDPLDGLAPEKRPPRQQAWFRAVDGAGDDSVVNQVLLAYASDMLLLKTGLYPHGVSLIDRRLQAASLDHAIWFHRPVRFTDWHLYDMDSPSASGARSFNRGLVYSRDGVLVASTAQEGLIRFRESRA